MAIVAGNVSNLYPIPSSNTYTYNSHSQNTGTGGYLVVTVASVANFGQTITGVKWNNVSMTQVHQGTISTTGANTRLAQFILASPATGAKSLVVTWSGTMSYGCLIQIRSFTGASTGGNHVLGTPTTTPNAPSMSISTNSMVLGVSLSRYTINNIELPRGTTRTMSPNNQPVYLASCSISLSPSLALNGSQTFETNCTTGYPVALSLLEIKAAATATIPTVTTTSISDITGSTASSGGNVTSDGGASVTARGVCWVSGVGTPTTANSKTINGSGTGIFTSSITSLSSNTTYSVRAYATNSAGTSYGSVVQFTTDNTATVTTTAISNIGRLTASSGGNVTSDGGEPVTARGVCWSTSINPTIANSKTTNGSGTGSFSSSIAGLIPNTLYYVRCYATNSVGTSYGSNVTFTTYRRIIVV